MGGLVLGILVWQEGGEAVGLLLAIGAISLAALRLVAGPPQARGQADADRPGPVHVEAVQARDLGPAAPERRARRRDDHHPDLPADGPRVQRAAGGPVAGAALAEHVRDGDPRRPPQPATAGRPASSGRGSRSCWSACSSLIPIIPRADAGWYLARPAGDRRDRARAAGLPAQQLHAGADRRGAGQRSRRRELGRRLVRAVVRPGVRRRDHAGHARLQLHQPGGAERGARPGPAAGASPTRSSTTRRS